MLNYCANGPSGYNLTNSLRFRSSASAYLNRTYATPTNNKIWTFSTWIKRGSLTSTQCILATSSEELRYIADGGASGVVDSFQYNYGAGYGFRTNATYRDPSAWYHVVVAVDTTQATASNRAKIYINGIQASTDGTYDISQNANTQINSAVAHNIGRRTAGSLYFDGYMTEINFIDGQALTPSSFGSTNTTTGVWQPAKYTGTYGTNGFYLPFKLSNTSTYSGYSTDAGSIFNTLPTGSQGTNFTFSGDMTIEGWVYYPTNVADQSFYVQSDGTNYLALNIDTTTSGSGTSGKYTIYCNSGTPTATITHGIVVGTWNHVAMVRSGSTITLYTNGVSKGTFTNSSTLGYSSLSLNRFGGGASGARYLSNVRITKSAVYTANFIPPSSTLTNIANTVVLTYQNSSAIDNSSNAYAIGTTGAMTYPVAYPFTANIAADYSGNANNWTPNNIQVSTSTATTYDSMTDVPTLTSATVGNYCTINPLLDLQTYATYSEGNLKVSTTASAGYSMRMQSKGTMAIPSSGKWYFAANAGDCGIIIGNDDPNRTQYGASILTTNVRYQYNGDVLLNNNSYATVASFTVSDEVGFAIDMDALTVGIYKNGSLLTTVTGVTSGFTYYPMTIAGSSSTSYTAYWNFGQRPFAYTPPTGYKTLNTYNLPTSTIVQGNKYMDATLYTGTAANQTVVNAGSFQPDLVWTKGRSYADYNALTDSVRGASIWLSSNTTSAEANYTGTNSGVKSFVSNGFTLEADGSEVFNKLNATYVGWQWQAGQGTNTTNTSGSITSTVSVNASAGFSVATWTAPSSGNWTIGHGLGVAPSFIITKSRSAGGWIIYHSALGNTKWLEFTTGAAQTGTSFPFNSVSPTSTLITYGNATSWGASANFVTYSWAEIAGFSKFGSYTGNGSTDGPFVYLGFRPKFIMYKKTTTGTGNSHWWIFDSSRNLYNLTNSGLNPDGTYAENSTLPFTDFLSNGFKLRTDNGENNDNGQPYIYAAFAENPFKNALAR